MPLMKIKLFRCWTESLFNERFKIISEVYKVVEKIYKNVLTEKEFGTNDYHW